MCCGKCVYNYLLSSSSSSSCSWRIRHVILFLDPQDEVGPSISSSVVLCLFFLLVYIVVLVLVVCLCPSFVHVVATSPNILRTAVTHVTKQYTGNIVCKLTGAYVATVRMCEVFTRLAEIVVMPFIHHVNTGRYEGHILFIWELGLWVSLGNPFFCSASTVCVICRNIRLLNTTFVACAGYCVLLPKS